MNFEFATAARIIFGCGKSAELPSIVHTFGQRPLLVHRTHADITLPGAVHFRVKGEPTIPLVREGAELARRERCDVVVGFGGGSAIDAAKAIAALLANDGDPLDYVEVIGKGKPVAKPSVPFIAVPTTAGAGAEVTRNAVLAAPEHRIKVSMRSPHMLARVALVDPQLTIGLPPAVTASTGLDALTQLIEPFLSTKANPMTDAFCREGMRLVARSLRRAFERGNDLGARTEMSVASLFGGLALANAGLGAVHGLAAPIGGMFPSAPHGAVCAALLPHVLEANARRAPNRDRINEVRSILGDVAALVRDLQIPGLASYGIREADFPAIIEKAQAASSMKANPVILSPDDLREVLSAAL
ncbi:MAG: iron-containing alcohol dehydrogenase [Verrucomicrobiae bacterium]|nr:iron-containing alcohol dehydrogenase [Verrucomicrobiae bacterium]